MELKRRARKAACCITPIRVVRRSEDYRQALDGGLICSMSSAWHSSVDYVSPVEYERRYAGFRPPAFTNVMNLCTGPNQGPAKLTGSIAH